MWSYLLIEFGEFINCSIDPAGDTDLFRFIGSIGEKVVVQATDQFGYVGPTVCITLFGPDGMPTANGKKVCGDITACIDETIAQNGTYSILVQEGGARTMSYGLAVERAAPPSPSSTALCFGCRIAAAIDDNGGDLDLYHFNGAQGNVITVQATDQFGYVGPTVCITLFGPDGMPTANGGQVCGDITAHIDESIAQNGTHSILSILVQEAGARTMPYAVSLQCVSGNCPPLELPTVAIALTGCTSCRPGDTFRVEATFKNTAAQPLNVEIKAGVVVPDRKKLNIWLVPDKHFEFSLPAGFDLTIKIIDVRIPDGLVKGMWLYEAALIEPQLGRTLSRDVKSFTIE